ncbi:MFS transporter [Burkholderia sp. BCC1985]|uniref:MFS transporter n=1 Tax=Burkholderia sp. BCC1985 TaxID=2817442 RepID=UPI002AB07644|nr:MFS transporter [Burkholderia sp. BCC1985]
MKTGDGRLGADASITRALWALYLCCFTSLASMRICDAMLPSLETHFTTTPQHAARTISLFALTYGASQLFFGPLGDRIGKIRVVGVSAAVSALGNLAASASGNIDQLIFARVAAGVMTAGIVPMTMAWIGDNVRYERRQEILAGLLGATVLGTIYGQWAGGLISSLAGWRTAFVTLAVAFGAGGMLTLMQTLPHAECRGPAKSPFWRDVVSVLRTPWARMVLLIAMFEGALAYGALAFLPTHFHDELGFPMSEAGLVVGLYGIGGLFYSRAAKILRRHAAEAGFAAIGGVVLLGALGLLAGQHERSLSLIACFGAGFGFYMLHNTLQLNATQMNPECRGTAVALFSCFLFLGQSIGVLVGVAIVQHRSTSALLLTSGIGLLATAAIFSFLLLRRRAAVAVEQTRGESARHTGC